MVGESNKQTVCAHPTRLRMVTARDVGWGDMAFCYEWDSTSGNREEKGIPDLEASVTEIWRYSLQKHGRTAYMDLSQSGYVGDSADIGFGPYSEVER